MNHSHGEPNQNGANNQKGLNDYKFENTMLVAEVAALRKEVETARAERDTANRQVAELLPRAKRATQLERQLRDATAQLEEMKTAAKASDNLIAENAELRNTVNRLERWRQQAATDLTQTQTALRNREARAAELKTDKEDAEDAARRWRKECGEQQARGKRFRMLLIGTAAALALSIGGSVAGYYKLTSAPPELSADAALCWQQYSAEYKQVFATAMQPWNERIKAQQQEIERLQMSQPSPFARDENDSWGFWDWLWALGFFAAGAVAAGFLMIFLILNSVR